MCSWRDRFFKRLSMRHRDTLHFTAAQDRQYLEIGISSPLPHDLQVLSVRSQPCSYCTDLEKKTPNPKSAAPICHLVISQKQRSNTRLKQISTLNRREDQAARSQEARTSLSTHSLAACLRGAARGACCSPAPHRPGPRTAPGTGRGNRRL